jgi:exonuclease SbcD
MRILHSADWHAGKTLYRQDRTPDLKFALDQMLELIEAQQVELVVVPGDLYDGFHPPAEASQVLFAFFLELSRRQIPSVLIAGNHDSSRHWGSLRQLLSLAHVHVFHEPALEAHLSLDLPGGRLALSALPYPNERRLVSLLDNHAELGQRHAQYAQRVEQLLGALAARTPAADFQILLSHLMMNGAKPGKGERELTLAHTYAVHGQALPAHYDYIALGHIHRRQPVSGSTAPAWYCGSPFQMDFGESETEKGVLIVELTPGRAARVEFHALEPLNPLHLVEVHEDELSTRLTSVRDLSGWIKLRVRTEGPRKGLAEQLRREVGRQLMQVDILSPRELVPERLTEALPLENPLEVYQAWYQAQDRTLSPELAQTFQTLWEEALS